MNFRTLSDGRRYGQHTPRFVDANPAAVVVLHGGGLGSPEQVEHQTGWTHLANKTRRFIVIYPEGLQRTWNAGNGALGYAGANNVDDVGFVLRVLRDVMQRVGFDRSRVFVSGFSNGSMLAHWIGQKAPMDVSAIAGVSGGFSRVPTFQILGSPGVRIVHGKNDQHVPFDGGVGTDALQPYDYRPIMETVGWWHGQTSLVETRFGDWGHEWPEGETEAQWKFFQRARS